MVGWASRFQIPLEIQTIYKPISFWPFKIQTSPDLDSHCMLFYVIKEGRKVWRNFLLILSIPVFSHNWNLECMLQIKCIKVEKLSALLLKSDTLLSVKCVLPPISTYFDQLSLQIKSFLKVGFQMFRFSKWTSFSYGYSFSPNHLKAGKGAERRIEKTQTYTTQPLLDHYKSRLGRILDPHCTKHLQR